MTKETNKFHALQLFTDTFTAETVHLTNEAIGIYIRLLSFAWTKNAKPFKTESAYRICQCKTEECKLNVDEVLGEFFKVNPKEDTWTNKRLLHEHAYLTDKYNARAEAGKKGGLAKRDLATSKTQAPIPIPKPIPSNNIYDLEFEKLWNNLYKRRGSKFKAYKEFKKINIEEITNDQMARMYNNQIKEIEDVKFIPHFSTWLSQRRWEIEENNQIPDLIDRLKALGYIYKGSEGSFEKFTKDGKSYRIDKFDEKHQIQLDQ
ncbi:MAG: hypothetical protein CL556_11555 [Alphaproteobacteria bacterium]|nr:hypothetical protein [Alphaproteobacteria bacterium]|tara:strand:+ start:34 stop:816 length:783 start_codon:yes stop_codon:yes gene_type:complete